MPIDIPLNITGTLELVKTGRDTLIVNGTQANELESEVWRYDEGFQNDDTRIEATPTPSTGVQSTKKPNQVRARKITADLDIVDKRVHELKERGLTIEAIAKKISEEGLATYAPKSLESRYVRTRKLLETKEEERLDDELSDWHVDEDDVLNECFKDVDDQLRKEIAMLEAKRWKKVAGAVASQLNKRKFSANACHKRFEGLQSASAVLPIELDPDKDARREATQKRIDLAKRTRIEEEAARKAAETERGSRLKADKVLKAEANKQRIEQEIRKREIAENKARKQAAIRAEKQSEKAALNRCLQHSRSEAHWKKSKDKTEVYILNCLKAGVTIGSLVPQARANRSRASAQIVIAEDNDVDNSNDEREAIENLKISGRAPPALNLKSSSSATPKASLSGTAFNTVPKKDKDTIKVKVTPDTLLNPRSIMTMEELKVILRERRLPPCGPSETQPQLVARLHAHDLNLNTTSLDIVLKSKHVSTAGKKDFKVRKLQNHDAEASTAGELGVRASDSSFKLNYEGYQDQFAYLLASDL